MHSIFHKKKFPKMDGFNWTPYVCVYIYIYTFVKIVFKLTCFAYLIKNIEHHDSWLDFWDSQEFGVNKNKYRLNFWRSNAMITIFATTCSYGKSWVVELWIHHFYSTTHDFATWASCSKSCGLNIFISELPKLDMLVPL